MRKLLALITCLWSLSTMAGHILGGEMTYTHQGNDQYEVRVQLFKECGVGADLDGSITIGVFRANGTLLTNLTPNLQPVINIPVESGNPCIVTPPNLCIQRGLYIATVTLPPGQGAYTLTFQRCCRGTPIGNMNNPSDQGSTFTIQVPDAAVHGHNSSPAFDDYPDLALCLAFDNTIVQPATDPDGDELVFELAIPYQGGTTMNPIPTPSAPPYTPVNMAPGYSVANLLNTTPPLTINPTTGTMQVTPAAQNRFVIGVKVKEYRNGQLLSELLRDLIYVVTPCQGVQSTITDLTAEVRCGGLQVQFENNSTGTSNFHWDFGVPGTLADTSNLAEPVFTFPAEGEYDITLIGSPGSQCSDTAVMTYSIYLPRVVEFEAPPIQCLDGRPVPLEATGYFLGDATFVWAFPGGVSPDMNTRTPEVTYADTGTYTVTVTVAEHGCSDTYTGHVRVLPLPVAGFMADDPAGCQPHVMQFVDSSYAYTPLRYEWTFGDGGSSTDASPHYSYADSGTFSVRLVVRTDSGCIASDTVQVADLVEVWNQPKAKLEVTPRTTSLLEPYATYTDLSEGIVWRSLTVEGAVSADSIYTHQFADAGHHPAVLTVMTDMGCVDTAMVTVFVADHLAFAPTAVTPNGDGLNDTWRVHVKGARKYRLEIFDRWGALRFTSNDPLEEWTPGAEDTGLFVYKAWLSEFGSSETEYTGSFMVLR